LHTLVKRIGPVASVLPLLFGGLVARAAASDPVAETPKSLEQALEPDGLYAVIETTFGTLACRLEFERTPVTVGSFVGLAEGLIPFRDPSTQQPVTRPFYDGLRFHRVQRDFVIQGGDPLGDGTGGPGYAFIDEFRPDLRHDGPGVLSMANSGPGTNGSQFFITLARLPQLDNRHTIFGRLVYGFDVLETIASQPSDRLTSRPYGDIVMTHVRIVRRGARALAFDPVAAFERQDEIEAQREIERRTRSARFLADLDKEFVGCHQLDSGVRYVVKAEGSGMKAREGDMITAHYVGFLEDGTKFDSSYDRNVPFRFPLGRGRVIRGWDEVVVNMRTGEKRRIVVPPQLAYGERGHKRFGIPPNATLIFDIEIVEILRR